MSNNDYNIDDILLEARLLKDKSKQADFPSSNTEAALEQKDLDEALIIANDLFAKVEKPAFMENSPAAIPEELLAAPTTPDKFEPPSTQEDFFVPESIPVDIPQEPKPEPQPKPRTPNKPVRVRRSGERMDLFDFQPEKRDKPIVTGDFGQKHFVFNKNKPAAVTESKSPSESLEQDFQNAFREGEETPQLQDIPVTNNPFDREFGAAYNKEKIRQRYQNIAGDTTKIDSVSGIKPSETPSPFATFATGTGTEIDIEEIKKIDFSALEGAGGYYDDEDVSSFADDIPEGHYMGFDEFSPSSDRQKTAKKIADTKLGIFVRTGIILLLTIVLFYLSASAKNIKLPLPPFIFPTGSTLPTFMVAQLLILAALMTTSISTVINGIVGLFKMRSNSDTLVTFSLIGAAAQTLVLVKEFREIDPETITFMAPVAALVLLFNYLAKLGVLSRIQRNFKVVAANRVRKGVSSIASPAYCRKLMPNVTDIQPNIVYGSESLFFKDFLSLSFSMKYDVGINRAVAPICIIGAVIITLVAKFLLDDNVLAATAFSTIICVCSTLSAAFIENLPMNKASNKLSEQGAMISGNKAVENFCDTAGVVLTEKDIFPKGHAYLNGIKAFPKGQIDQAILDAASVLCVLEGTLGDMFLNMIGGDKKLLKKVDNVVYENNMGLSGWVDGRRVLIGNRMLMQNHGIKLPNDSYERNHPTTSPGNPIYVSNSGEVSARFLVEYTADEELAGWLEQLAVLEKQLIIYTTDANITPEKINEIYGYPTNLVTVMSSELQDAFREISAPQEEMPAEIVYLGKASSFIAAIIAAINARSSILIGTIFQLIQIIFGYAVITLTALTGGLTTFGTSKILIYLLVWFAVIMIAQKFRKS